MMRRHPGHAWAAMVAFLIAGAGAGAQATSSAAMRRALEASMERVLLTERYLGSVTGLTRDPSRMTRSDGFVYLSDLAPVMHSYAERGDSGAYRSLRRFLVDRLVFDAAGGPTLARRHRADVAPEVATPYGYIWTLDALLEGWRTIGDTASAQLLARLDPSAAGEATGRGAMYKLSTDCGDALEAVRSDPAPARDVLRRARSFVGSAAARQEQLSIGVTASEGEVDLLSCLTRVGLALNDPDATVRYLDRMLDLLQPLREHSGRTDLGTGADVLLTLHRVRLAGPRWAAPSEPDGR